LKRNAVPIPFDEVTASNKNIRNDNEEEQREQREIIQIEQVPHCEEANMERIQSTEVVASTSYLPNCNAVIADKCSERHPLQYRAARLYFDTSMEEEDIIEWMHLEPPSRERVTPLPLNKSTEAEENKLCLELSTHKKVLEPLSSNKYIEDKENNMTVIRKLHMKIISLKSENSRLRKQVRKLKFRLHHTVRIRKTTKKNK